MTRPQTRRVAVIGAGISGVLAAGHLLAAGIEVTVFERNEAPGGVWYGLSSRLYDERPPPGPSYPAMRPSKADPPATDGLETEQFMLAHAPPGPCYYHLQNNVPTPLLEVTLDEWPMGTPDTVRHDVVRQYIHDISVKVKAHDATVYGARVTALAKDGTTWRVSWSTPQEDMTSSSCGNFDAVVVASGHYHAPRVPDIPGLAETKRKYGTRVLHSKEYRRPETFTNKTILMIGGGVSSVDIANDLSPVTNTIYQSTRKSKFDLDPSMLPQNAVRVDEISQFELHDHGDQPLSEDEPVPVSVHFESGQSLHGIDAIMLCTGYHLTLPFLRDYHRDTTPLHDADETVLITDGTQIHNLYKDIFYMPDPTLVFVGLPYYTFTFSVFDFQAIVAAQVLAGHVELPPEAEMRLAYMAKVHEVGLGKPFHSLLGTEEVYVQDLLSWVNGSRTRRGLALAGRRVHLHARVRTIPLPLIIVLVSSMQLLSRKTCENPPVRREWRSLTESERTDFTQAIICLANRPSQWQQNGSIYDDFAILHGGIGSWCHRSASFLPWHRYTLVVFENTLREQCGFKGQIPYWDWSLDWMDLAHSSIWDSVAGFGGDGDPTGPEIVGDGRCVVDGPFVGLRPILYNHTYVRHCIARGFRDGETVGRISGSYYQPESIGAILRKQTYEELILCFTCIMRNWIVCGGGGSGRIRACGYMSIRGNICIIPRGPRR
ncbi:hypothetical protein BDV28DRAFT_162473 [Aspergillus coremiiformis]|uniref:Tyrosinase copper-binding domain-containing protein n=1 Tax=Aspergillus coremiiformis TaxID=138285 RepID=A0A5N6Z3K2_9EURO|nr:hypothetical protein BDV28DRAFT_162473 [Aspergillus coremiiformis]